MDVHSKLRTFLNDKGWTEYRLSKESGLSAICRGFGITLSQFFAEDEMVELSPELKELFDGWVTLTADQKKAVLQMIQAFQKST